jgi:hypothetical protein
MPGADPTRLLAACGRVCAPGVACLVLALSGPSRAQEAAASSPPPRSEDQSTQAAPATERRAEAEAHAPEADAHAPSRILAEQLAALARARLLHVRDATERELFELVERAEALHFDGHDAEAVALLLEALESPRFADFGDLPAYVAAEHAAATSLVAIGSLATARHYLKRAITRGARSPYYGPAIRGYVDVALALGDSPEAARWLAAQQPKTPDGRDELSYLTARARYDAGDHDAAVPALNAVGERSRFHPSAQYLLGAIAAEEKRYRDAERRFCKIAGPGKSRLQALYVDGRYFDVVDLARLGLGRVAHEQRRGDDAFYYYFQIPRDSRRLPDSLFEGAWASYESEQHDLSLDLLDQLDAHFPSSGHADEAAVLRGYVALGRCDFEQADKHFQRFLGVYEPLLGEVTRAQENPTRRRALDEVWRARQRGGRAGSAAQRRLLSLLEEDPDLERMRAQLVQLDQEAARGGRVADELDAVLARVQGIDKPAPIEADAAAEAATRETLDRDLELARQLARGLAAELDALREAGVAAARVRPLERQLSALSRKLEEAEHGARWVPASGVDEADDAAVAGALGRDVKAARALPARVHAVREELARAIDARVEASLAALRDRIAGMLQRARIGRIDAVMGSKRRIELQIESLAAGRFPPELRDPLLVQGLLADDEEYWPFEGEDWPDEYEERYGGDEDGGETSAQAAGKAP